ncbi:MAG: NUDIX hydrolase [Chloroflexi bacterium]|nr:MAG: NUDIX hydrolase [Chloroflexota bacterium]
MQAWEKAGEPREEKIGWRKLTHKSFVQPDGKVSDFSTYGGVSDQAAGVIAITPDNMIVIAEQFRPGPETVMQEIPGGGVEPGEDPLVAAMRELREETGYTSGDVVYLGSIPRDAYMNGVWHYYLAQNCLKTEIAKLDESEFVDVKLISIGGLIRNAKTGRMSDPAAVLMAYDLLNHTAAES